MGWWLLLLGHIPQGGDQGTESVQGQVGWGPGQPELVGGSPAHGREMEHHGLYGLFQPKPFYDSLIIF